MTSRTTQSNGRPEAEQQDFKWAVEWLVRQQGQRRAAATLGVNRKTVALALRRERLTARMNHAVQTLLANLDNPGTEEVMPLDRMEAQIAGLVEGVDDIFRLIDGLTLRVEALEEGQVEGEALPPVDDLSDVHGQRDQPVGERERDPGQALG